LLDISEAIMETFFISDTHFGHKNIIKFDGTKDYRPFATIEEHDAELIRRWNSVVGKRDNVFHLGDFCFSRKNIEIAAQLNGVKRLVLGNHDMYPARDYLKYFKRLSGAIEWHKCILTHIPVHIDQLNRYEFNIHGHLHHNKINDIRYVNVACEHTNLTPVTLDDLCIK
jgi:calcineurin-like phosphoesterase family protein